MRIQDQFAESVKNTFIVHLKLKNIWNKFDIKETDFDIKFVPPTNFFEMREAQKLEIKYNAFNNMVQNESVSKTYAQKKYLKWNDQEILANRAFLKKDKELEFELAQITANGPNWRQLIAGGAGEQVEGQPMAAGGGGAIPTGEAPVPTGAGPEGAAETPPAFGPPPAGGAPAQAPAAPTGGTPADFTPETPPA